MNCTTCRESFQIEDAGVVDGVCADCAPIGDDAPAVTLDPLARAVHAEICETTTEECAWDEGPCVKAAEVFSLFLTEWGIGETTETSGPFGLFHGPCGPVELLVINESMPKLLRLIGEHECEAR